MKSLIRISFLLIFFMMSVNAQEVENNHENTLEIIAIHQLELMPGVDAKEFETFVLEQIAPIYSKMKGQKAMLVKGDRGAQTGKYALVLTFESVEDRDKIYPLSGELNGDWGDDALWEKLRSMLKKGIGTAYTDYVNVVN